MIVIRHRRAVTLTLNGIQVTVMIAKVGAAVSDPVKWFAKNDLIEFTEQQRMKLEIVKH